jgi:hypothetical protein
MDDGVAVSLDVLPINYTDEHCHPMDWYELNSYLEQVRDAEADSNFMLPEYGLLLRLEEDAFTFRWTTECEAQLRALEACTSIPFTVPDITEEEEVIHCNKSCCPGGIHQYPDFNDNFVLTLRVNFVLP